MSTRPLQSKSVLLVDADLADREALRICFADLGLDLIETDSVEKALDLVRECQPALVLSELRLPDASGFSLVRQLRADGMPNSLPVVLISGWATETDRILAFEAGADDFVAKPFYPRELSSRIQAVLRRCRSTEHLPPIDGAELVDPLEIRFDAHEVRVGDRAVGLTPREFALLLALVRRRGRVLNRRDLIAQAWGGADPPHARSVDAHVKSLRRKLGLPRDAIETVRGLGYRFTENVVLPDGSGSDL